MGYAVVSPCLPSASDAATYAAPLPPGYQVVSCSATSPFYELTPQQKADFFSEGLTLGWAVGAVMVAAWAVHILRRAI